MIDAPDSMAKGREGKTGWVRVAAAAAPAAEANTHACTHAVHYNNCVIHRESNFNRRSHQPEIEKCALKRQP